jgi:hypothetical protein
VNAEPERSDAVGDDQIRSQAPLAPESNAAEDSERRSSLRQRFQETDRYLSGHQRAREFLIDALLIIAAIPLILALASRGEDESDYSIYLVAVFIALGLLAVRVMRALDAEKVWPYLVLVALPVVLYLMVNGQVAGLRVPGGFEVELERILEDKPDFVYELRAPADLQGGNTVLLNCGSDVNAVVVHPPAGIEPPDLTSVYVTINSALVKCGNLRYVAFADVDNDFAGMVSADSISQKLKADVSADVVTTGRGTLHLIFRQPEIQKGLTEVFGSQQVLTSSVPEGASAGEILQRMQRDNIPAIAVVDADDGNLEAVVERESLVSQILMQIAGIDETPLPTSTPTPKATTTSAPGPTETPLSAAATPTAVPFPAMLTSGTPPIGG